MIHSLHVAHHVRHCQPGRRSLGGYGRAQAWTGRQGAAGKAGAIHGLSKDRAGIVLGSNYNIECLSRAEAQLVNCYRLNR